MKSVTICVLTFGDQLDLVRRCLDSIMGSMPPARVVEEIRICLTDCTDRVRGSVRAWSEQLASKHRIPSTHYVTDSNQVKYPLMRRMLRQPGLIRSPYTMWFDDDSYLDSADQNWWSAMLEVASRNDMIGQKWLMPVQGNQWAWIQSQPWYNPKVGLPKQIRHKGKLVSAFNFCQGAWWVARTEILLKHDWPLAEIRHNGGDSMLGELCRHQKLRMGVFYGGTHINADGRGRHSKSRRRGHSENRVGWDYQGRPLETKSHHQFSLQITKIPAQDSQRGIPELL